MEEWECRASSRARSSSYRGPAGDRPRHRAGFRARRRADRAGLLVGRESRGRRQGDCADGTGAVHRGGRSAYSSRPASNCLRASTNGLRAAMCWSTMRARRAPARSLTCRTRSGSTATRSSSSAACGSPGCSGRCSRPPRDTSSTSSAARRARLDPEFLIGGSVNAAMANFTKGLSRLGNARRRQRQRHPPGQYR